MYFLFTCKNTVDILASSTNLEQWMKLIKQSIFVRIGYVVKTLLFKLHSLFKMNESVKVCSLATECASCQQQEHSAEGSLRCHGGEKRSGETRCRRFKPTTACCILRWISNPAHIQVWRQKPRPSTCDVRSHAHPCVTSEASPMSKDGTWLNLMWFVTCTHAQNAAASCRNMFMVVIIVVIDL